MLLLSGSSNHVLKLIGRGGRCPHGAYYAVRNTIRFVQSNNLTQHRLYTDRPAPLKVSSQTLRSSNSDFFNRKK
jgi:hypothetical protein